MKGVRLCIFVPWLLAAGCTRQPQPTTTTSTPAHEDLVVVYTALDRQFSEPILAEFTARTGVRVQAAYDTESTKTVGLANRIRAEAARPRCDVFWNNEILNTLRLKNEGLLQPCRPSQAANYPAQFQDPEGYWYGFAARARVLIVNTELVQDAEYPMSIRDLADPRWRGRTGLAKPLFGTTASHVACLFAYLGDGPARDILASFKANQVLVAAGNKTCAEMVGAGRLAFGLTDTDDALIEQESGKPVRMIFPDQGPEQMGTLLLPNTLALVKGCPQQQAGEQLIDFLLSPEVETRLALGPSGQLPLNRLTAQRSRAGAVAPIHVMEVDFSRAAELFQSVAEYVKNEFLEP